MIIERNQYLDQLIERKHNSLIKIVTGIRRCGKSFLLNEIFTNHLIDNGVDDKEAFYRFANKGGKKYAYEMQKLNQESV